MSKTSAPPSSPDAGSKQASNAIDLPERVDIRTAPELIEQLRAGTGEVTLNADRVEVMTSAGLQVLLAATRSGERDLDINAPSAAFLDCLALLGSDLNALRSTQEVAG